MIYYFDNAATTKIKPEVLEEMMPYLTEEYGNPSSLYGPGRKAKRAIEKAREQVASLINCEKNEIYFTSCGSESDNTAIKGIAELNNINIVSMNENSLENKENQENEQSQEKAENNKNETNKANENNENYNKANNKEKEGMKKRKHIITTKIEHHAILESCKKIEKQGIKVTYLDVDKDGLINLEELEKAITDETILISIMFANNEIGTIEPIEKIAEIAKKKKIIFHTDAVQAVGNVPIDVKKMGIDMLSLSGHKINAPKGIGALYVKNGIKFEKFIHGGHQEKNMRSGTENLAGIVGLGKACEIAKENLEKHSQYLKELREYYIHQISKNIENIKINGSMEHRLPGNCNISFKGVDSTALLLELDKRGICVSNGSACNSSESTPSHVLMAIGLDENIARSAIRVTFGECNTRAQIDYLVNNIKYCIELLGTRTKSAIGDGFA